MIFRKKNEKISTGQKSDTLKWSVASSYIFYWNREHKKNSLKVAEQEMRMDKNFLIYFIPIF